MSKNPQKILKNRYMVVARTLILLFDGRKVLLQKGAPTKKLWAGLYNGLGGHIERGEDVISAAKREAREESGLAVHNLQINGVVMIDVEPEQGICMFVCSGNDLSGTMKSSDEGLLEWVDVSELGNHPCVEDLPIIIPRVMKGDFFSLQYLYGEDGKLIVREGV